MAKGEDITTKYKVDISDLKRHVSEATKLMQENKASFNKAASSLDDWGKSSIGLKAKIEQLTKDLDAQNKKLDSYKKQQQELNKGYEENGKRAIELKKKLEELANKGVSKTSLEYKKYQKTLTEIEKEQLSNKKASDSLKITILNQEAAINKTQKELNNYSASLIKVEKAEKSAAKSGKTVEEELKNIEEASKKAHDNLNNLTSLLSSGIKKGFKLFAGATTGAVVGLIASSEASQEFVEDMGKLETAFTTSGHSAETAKKAYKNMVGILGETDQSVEAVNHLAKLTKNEKELAKWSDIAAGIYGTFGDSLPIEGLTEAANETAKVAKVTGPLADALNWAKMSMDDWKIALGGNTKAYLAFKKAINDGLPVEDAFNEALSKINKEQERSTFITNSLNGIYSKAGKKYQEINKDLIEARKAQSNLTEANAEMGRVVTPVVSRVKNIFANFLKSITPKLKEFINDIDWEKFGRKAENGLNKLTDGLGWLLKNGDKVTRVTKMFLATLIVKKINDYGNSVIKLGKNFNTVSKEIKLTTGVTKNMNTAQKASTVANNLVTKSWKGLGSVIKANPIGATITAITLGISSFKKLSEWINKSKENTNEYYLETKKLTEEIKNFTNSINDNIKSRKENINNIEVEANSADVLYKKLLELESVENKTNAQKEIMTQIVANLNELMPSLNLQYNKEKDALNLTTEALKKQIKTQKDLMKAKAGQEILLNISKDIAYAELKLSEAQEKHNENLETYNRKVNERKKAEDEYRKSSLDDADFLKKKEAWVSLSNSEKKLKEAVNASSEAVKESKTNLKNLNKEFSNTENYISNHLNLAEIEKKFNLINEKCKQKSIEIPKSVSEGIKNGQYVVPASVSEMQELIKFDNAINKAKKDGINITDNLSKSILSKSSSIKAANNSINKYINFQTAVNDARKKGIEIPDKLSENILNGKVKVETATENIKKAIKQKMNGTKNIGIDAGGNLVEGTRIGINNKKSSLSKTIVNLGTDMLNIFKRSLDEHSPSKTTQKYGQWLIDGLKNGITDKTKGLFTQITKLGSSTLNSFENSVDNKKYKNAAQKLSSYISDGLKNNSITDSIITMTNETIKKSRKMLSNIQVPYLENYQSLKNNNKQLGNNTTNNVINNFNQYNTSPKPLSRIELYRQTKNLLNLKGR